MPRRSASWLSGILFVTLVPFAPLAAQSVAPLEAPAAAPVVVPGIRVRFTPPWSDSTIEGAVTRRWSDSVSVHPDGEPSPVSLRLADMRALSVSDGRTISHRTVVTGSATGAVVGALLGAVFITTGQHYQGGEGQKPSVAPTIAVSALFGAIVGGIGGTLRAPEHWRPVDPSAR